MSEDLHNKPDWRLDSVNNVERWKKARKGKIFTDIDFLVCDGTSTQTVSAHKVVLALSSPVFEAMFFGLLPEKNPIEIKNTCVEAFKNLISHLYGESVSFTSVTIAAMTYLLADQYIVEDLRLATLKYLHDTCLNDSQFWELYLNEDFLLIPGMEQKCLDYIVKNAYALFKSSKLIQISSTRMQEIVTMGNINITEFDLLSALIEWGSKNVLSESELIDKLEPLLCFIRFHNLSWEQFCVLHECNPFFIRPVDALKIMKYIQNCKNYKLPEWCSVSTEMRALPETSTNALMSEDSWRTMQKDEDSESLQKHQDQVSDEAEQSPSLNLQIRNVNGFILSGIVLIVRIVVSFVVGVVVGGVVGGLVGGLVGSVVGLLWEYFLL